MFICSRLMNSLDKLLKGNNYKFQRSFLGEVGEGLGWEEKLALLVYF